MFTFYCCIDCERWVKKKKQQNRNCFCNYIRHLFGRRIVRRLNKHIVSSVCYSYFRVEHSVCWAFVFALKNVWMQKQNVAHHRPIIYNLGRKSQLIENLSQWTHKSGYYWISCALVIYDPQLHKISAFLPISFFSGRRGEEKKNPHTNAVI